MILLVAFTLDTPPYPLSMDGGTDGGSTEQTAMRAGKETVYPPPTTFSFTVSASVRRGRGDRLHPGQQHQETTTGTASTIPITVIKGIVDNLAVCFVVFPRVFLCLLLVFVLSCC